MPTLEWSGICHSYAFKDGRAILTEIYNRPDSTFRGWGINAPRIYGVTYKNQLVRLEKINQKTQFIQTAVKMADRISSRSVSLTSFIHIQPRRYIYWSMDHPRCRFRRCCETIWILRQQATSFKLTVNCAFYFTVKFLKLFNCKMSKIKNNKIQKNKYTWIYSCFSLFQANINMFIVH